MPWESAPAEAKSFVLHREHWRLRADYVAVPAGHACRGMANPHSDTKELVGATLKGVKIEAGTLSFQKVTELCQALGWLVGPPAVVKTEDFSEQLQSADSLLRWTDELTLKPRAKGASSFHSVGWHGSFHSVGWHRSDDKGQEVWADQWEWHEQSQAWRRKTYEDESGWWDWQTDGVCFPLAVDSPGICAADWDNPIDKTSLCLRWSCTVRRWPPSPPSAGGSA